MSKKRYKSIEDSFLNELGDAKKVDVLMGIIQKEMKFDPNAKVYTPELGQKMMASVRRRCERNNLTTYGYIKSDKSTLI